MIENLQDELYQLENKQAKGAKLRANVRSWRVKNTPKLSLKYLKDRIWKIKQYLSYILMIINQNILEILGTFLNLQKKSWNSSPSELPQLLLWFDCKLLNRKKISNKHFNLCEVETSLDGFIKTWNSETNNKPPGNDGLTAEFYTHFSNELAPILLGFYDCWGKLDTMGVTYRAGIISAIRAVSRTNYFRKTGERQKWERPK